METIKKNMGLPQQFFIRCPACYRNFLNIYCYQTCSPSNSEYVYNLKTENWTNPDTKKVVKRITIVDYFINPEFADAMFDSCKGVQMPSANERALSVFCGRPASQCNVSNWLTYMGDPTNGHTPFKINFNITEKKVTPKGQNLTFTPMNAETSMCNETALNKSACSCQDCALTCSPIPPPPAAAKTPTILGFDAWYFVMFIVYIVFILFFGTYVLCYNIVSRNAFGVCSKDKKYTTIEERNDGDRVGINGHSRGKINMAHISPPLVDKKDINCFERIGASIEKFLQTVFTKWGTFCARHPISIIIIGILIGAGLSAGIYFFKVTTNPVELWSAKNSRARMEKDYFDSHFG